MVSVPLHATRPKKVGSVAVSNPRPAGSRSAPVPLRHVAFAGRRDRSGDHTRITVRTCFGLIHRLTELFQGRGSTPTSYFMLCTWDNSPYALKYEDIIVKADIQGPRDDDDTDGTPLAASATQHKCLNGNADGGRKNGFSRISRKR